MIHAIADSCGIPARLRALLKDHHHVRQQVNKPQNSISANAVPQWHQWLIDHGEIIGRRREHGNYKLISPVNNDLPKRITRHSAHQDYECDISEISGLANSKSDLTEFSTLNAMAESRCTHLINQLTPENLQKLLSHSEFRIAHKSTHFDYFARYGWDNRIFLINDGGSHHFAAARYVARRLNQPVPLSATLHNHEIDRDSVIALGERYAVFVVMTAAYETAIRPVIESFRANFFETRLPRPDDDHTAILLSRDDWRSRQLIKVFREHNAFDLTQHLLTLANRQRPIQL